MLIGAERQEDNDQFENALTKGPDEASARPDPTQTDRFLFDQTIHSLYGTYKAPLGAWTVQAGLRVKAVRIHFNQVTLGQTGRNDSERAYPSLRFSRGLGADQQHSLSYSRRVQRPDAYDLNPHPFIQDAISPRVGDPRLKPQLTDSGFTREALMAWCEGSQVDYVFGLARNARLKATLAGELAGRGPVRRVGQGGPGVPRLPLPDPGQLEPAAPGCRQGRTYPAGLQPPLHRHLPEGLVLGRAPPLRRPTRCAVEEYGVAGR